MLILAALALAVWVYLLGGHGFFWQAGPSLPPATPLSPAPSVTVIVPARDEVASIGRCLRSLLAQHYEGSYRVILVDDGSQDGTGEAASGISDARLTIIQGRERPVGWSGKLWALSQGIDAAGGEFLFLTDADIEHRPAHVATLVAKAQAGPVGLDVVSEMVALNCESVAERALVPAFVFFFALLYPFSQVNDAGSRVAAAAGGTVLIRAAALRRIGGIAALRGALIDDVTLAGLVKQQGRIWLGHSQLAASIRPYPAPGDVWRMIARTAFVQLRFSPASAGRNGRRHDSGLAGAAVHGTRRHRPGALGRRAGVGCDGRGLCAHPAALSAVARLGALPAAGGAVLHSSDRGFRGGSLARTGCGLEAAFVRVREGGPVAPLHRPAVDRAAKTGRDKAVTMCGSLPARPRALLLGSRDLSGPVSCGRASGLFP